MKVVRLFFGLIVALAMILAVLVIFQITFEPVHVVEGDEMAPQLTKGDAVFIKTIKPNEIELEQVIFMRQPGNREKIIARRVVEIRPSGKARVYITKADGLPENDDWIVSTSSIMGVVGKRVKELGSFVDLVTSSKGFLFCVILPGAAALLLTLLLGAREGAARRR